MPQSAASGDNETFFTLAHSLPHNDIETLNELFALAFPKSALEIKSAIQGGKYAGDELNQKGYHFTNSFVPVLRCARMGSILASSVVVEKKIVKKNAKGAQKISVVHEVVWFATFSELRGKGYGSRLFAELHALSSRAGAAAILCESCDTALSYWVGLTDVPIARPLIREKPRTVNESQSAEDKAALLWKEPNEACARRADRLMKLLLPKDKGGVFLQTRFPPAALEALYSEQLFRDKKGNVQSSSIFQGAPYRYGTPEATHVWFPISSSLRGGLGKADVVVRKKQPMCRAPPIDTSAASLEASADADNLPTSTVPATPCTPFANFSLSTPKVDSVSDGFAPESTVKAAADLMELATEPSETKADDDIFGQQTATKAKRKLSKQERQALERRRRAKLLAGEELSSDDEDETVVVRAPTQGNKRMLAGKRRTVAEL